MLEVIQVGSPVYLNDSIEGKVLAVCIKEHNHITYECGWWSNGTYNRQWFELFQISRTKDTNSTKIGFSSSVVPCQSATPKSIGQINAQHKQVVQELNEI